MASKRVEALIDAFRNHFRTGEQVDIPIALRQEPTDVVYRALIEEDKPVTPQLTPLINTPQMPDVASMGVEELLGGLDMGMPADMGMGPEASPDGLQAPVMPGGVEDPLTGL